MRPIKPFSHASSGRRRHRWWFAALLAAATAISGQEAASQQHAMLELVTGGRLTQGIPLSWNGQTLQLLERDGRLTDVTSTEAVLARQLTTPFARMDHSELQASLLTEFGDRFQVSGSGQYLVVYPSGQPDHWANRFETLYRSMIHYFSTRGIDVAEPPFPLVAVVFPNQDEFLHYAQSTGAQIDADWLGYYSTATNRIAMYDFDRGNSSQQDWTVNATTIVHEAAHQTAYNIGVHSRWTTTPRWLAEGLGTLFEAPGVYDAARHSRLVDRINQQQLAEYRQLFPERLKSHTLMHLLSDDRTFQRSSEKSYALSWALMFMLSEQQPMDLGDYLQLTAQRQPFAPYPADERIADFQQVFGDINTMQARLEEFIRQLQ